MYSISYFYSVAYTGGRAAQNGNSMKGGLAFGRRIKCIRRNGTERG